MHIEGLQCHCGLQSVQPCCTFPSAANHRIKCLVARVQDGRKLISQYTIQFFLACWRNNFQANFNAISPLDKHQPVPTNREIIRTNFYAQHSGKCALVFFHDYHLFCDQTYGLSVKSFVRVFQQSVAPTLHVRHVSRLAATCERKTNTKQ